MGEIFTTVKHYSNKFKIILKKLRNILENKKDIEKNYIEKFYHFYVNFLYEFKINIYNENFTNLKFNSIQHQIQSMKISVY